MTEDTLVIAKPEVVEVGEVEAMIAELKSLGMAIVASRKVQLTLDEGKRLYHELLERGKPWYSAAVRSIIRGPVVCLHVRGENAIEVVRRWRGPTDVGEAAEADCFRGRMLRKHGFGKRTARKTWNYAHASGNEREAAEEIGVVFPQ